MSLIINRKSNIIPNFIHNIFRCTIYIVTKINAGVVKGSETSSKTGSSSGDKPAVDIKVFMALVSRVERLEQELKLLHGKMGISTSASSVSKKEEVAEEYEYDESSEPEEEQAPAPRLMRKK